MILIFHLGEFRNFEILDKELFSVKLCCFVCPVGFVVNKAKTKGCSFFRVHQVK